MRRRLLFALRGRVLDRVFARHRFAELLYRRLRVVEALRMCTRCCFKLRDPLHEAVVDLLLYRWRVRLCALCPPLEGLVVLVRPALQLLEHLSLPLCLCLHEPDLLHLELERVAVCSSDNLRLVYRLPCLWGRASAGFAVLPFTPPRRRRAWVRRGRCRWRWGAALL